MRRAQGTVGALAAEPQARRDAARRGPSPSAPARGLLARRGYAGSVSHLSTKGVPVRLDFYHRVVDIEDGWVVDMVEAHTAEGPAGYLKISFIPASEMERCYPDALAWAVRKCGRYWGMRELLEHPETGWTQAQLRQALRACDGWFASIDRELQARREGAGEAELAEMWQARRAELVAEHADAYAQFRRFHLDCPLVDYIRVYDKSERQVWRDGRAHQRRRPLGRELRRQGIGTLLYETGALWMGSRGLELRASPLQSEDAKDVWATLSARGLVTSEGNGSKRRQALDAQRLAAQSPQLADAVRSAGLVRKSQRLRPAPRAGS